MRDESLFKALRFHNPCVLNFTSSNTTEAEEDVMNSQTLPPPPLWPQKYLDAVDYLLAGPYLLFPHPGVLEQV